MNKDTFKTEFFKLKQNINNLFNLFSKELLSFDRMLCYKYMVNSQKFSPYFERNFKKFLNYKTPDNSSIYGEYDAQDEFGLLHEIKYSTYDYDRETLSFPQIIRTSLTPDTYLLNIFIDNNVIICQIPGIDMENSIINKTSTKAHANNSNEKRINIKPYSEQMSFIMSYRKIDLEIKFKNYIFESVIE